VLVAGEEAIVEALEREMLMAHLLLGPPVAVEAELDRVREVGADFQERGTLIAVLHVEIVMIDEDRLAGEVKAHAALRTAALLGLERAHFLLGDADEDDTLGCVEVGAVLGGDSSLRCPRWNWTTGTLWRAAKSPTGATKVSCIGPKSAGDGMGYPDAP